MKALIKEAAGVLKGKTKVISKLNNPAKEGEVERTSDEAMETLLLLASHPQISLWSIKKCGHTHDRGIDTVARECLRWYLMLNLLVAMKEAGSPLGEEMDWDSARPKPKGFRPEKRYMQCEKYKNLRRRIDWIEICAVRRLQGEFFNFQEMSIRRNYKEMVEPDVLVDMNACQEYLKKLWRIMVIYDLVIREEGEDPDWVEEVIRLFSREYGIHYEIDFEGNKTYLLSPHEKKKYKR